MNSAPSRRTLLRGGLAVVALAGGGGLLAGCGKQTPSKQSESLQHWLRGLDGVADARIITAPGDAGGDADVGVRVTTTKGLPDEGVASLVAAIRKGWDSHGGELTSDLTLQIDAFAAEVYPEKTGVADTYLTRALWLRRDGHALSGAYDSASGGVYHVVAKAADVATVVLGINALERSQVSSTTVVSSTDASTAARWTDSSTGLAVDAAFVTKAQTYGRRYPGLTWWADFSSKKGGLYFPASGPTLDQVRAQASSYAVGTQMTQVEVGRGVARANSEQFAEAFAAGTKFRKLADAAQRLAGVTRVQLPAKSTPGDELDLDSVVVAGRAGYLNALRSLPAVWGDDYLPIKLIRGAGLIQPDLVVDPGLAEPVFKTFPRDDRGSRVVYEALADVLGVVEIGIGPEFTNLTVEPSISTADLTTALRAVRTLPTTYTGVGKVKNPYVIHLYASLTAEYLAVHALADIAGGTFGAPRQRSSSTPSAAEASIATRARTIWNSLR